MINLWIIFFGSALVISIFISYLKRQKREARLRQVTLQEKLLASTLKNPSDGPYYF